MPSGNKPLPEPLLTQISVMPYGVTRLSVELSDELSDISATVGLATTAGRSSVHIILTHIFNRTKCTTRSGAIISAQDKRNTVCFIASQSWSVSSNNGVCLAVWDLLTPLCICRGRLSYNIKYLPVATFVQLKLDYLNGTVQFEIFYCLIYIQCGDVLMM